MVKNFLNWMAASNRWKHLLLGLVIGLVADDAYCASLSGVCTAGAMELKDMQWGGKFDWIDFSLTMVGDFVGHLTRFLLWGK